MVVIVNTTNNLSFELTEVSSIKHKLLKDSSPLSVIFVFSSVKKQRIQSAGST